MASLQAYRSHGIQYYRIVESFRNDGKPSIRVLAHLGRVDDILQRHQQEDLQRRRRDPKDQRQVKEQIEWDRRADHFRHIVAGHGKDLGRKAYV